MHVLTRIRKGTEQSVITIYKKDRLRLKISKGDILIIRLKNGTQLVRPVHKDYHISLPCKLFPGELNGKRYYLKIDQIFKKEIGLQRKNLIFYNSKLDIRYFIPLKTYSNKSLYVFPYDSNSSLIWYAIGGGAEHIILRNLIDLEKIGELLGFYFGDGSTSEGLQSFRLTNSEPSTLIYSLQVLEELGIPRYFFKVQIIYSSNKEVTKKIKNRCIKNWSRQLNIPRNNCISVNKSKALSESLRFGSARIFLDNNTLVEVILRGLLPGIISRITKPKFKEDFLLLKGFLRGIFAAEGSVAISKDNRLSRVGLSFDPHSTESTFYRILLSHLGIQTSKDKGNEFCIFRKSNFEKLKEIDLFRFHSTRKARFNSGLNNYKTTTRGK